MSGTEALYLVLIVLCVFLSGLFSTAEMALVSLQRVRLEHLVNTGVPGAGLVARLVERPERLLSTVLTGNEVVQTAAATLATALAIDWWGQAGIIFATIGMVIILLIFCDTTPKIVAINHAERLSLTLARPVRIISWLLNPFVFVLSWISSLLTKLVGGTAMPRSLVSEAEIRTMISVGHREGTVEKEAAEMIHNVFEIGDRPVKEVMVPRPDVVFIEKGTTVADFLKVYEEHPFSRYPVYQEQRDNLAGILSIKDILMAHAKGTITNESLIDDLIKPACLAPETKPVNELLAEMRDGNFHMCVVVDEYGGTAGTVNFNQLIEEIIGPVGSEISGVERDYEVVDERTFQIDGGMRLTEANEEMELGLPEGDYETVAGFVLTLMGRIPRQGEQIKYKNLKIVITKMDAVKIEEILVVKELMDKTAGEKDAAPPN
jgi:putative hemolysin